MSQLAIPPYLTPGTEVSAKYKGAFCEAKIKRCQKSVKCKVSPKDGGPQISVADEAVQGDLKIGGSVKVRQPDSGQIIDGNISRIIDSSIYTVVFDDGDVATLKRTQICLKGDKHYMESDTLDRLPLTNPEHFSTPVNLLKKERRRRSGFNTPQSSGTVSEDSDVDEEAASTSRRISPRGTTKPAVDIIGRVVSLEMGDRKKWAPALVIKPSNHEADMRNKGLFMVKSFRDNKIFTVTEKQVKEFNKDIIKTYTEDKLTKAAVEKALKYVNTKELPTSWRKEEILGQTETPKSAPPTQTKAVVMDRDSGSSSDDAEEEERRDMFIAQLYKFMDDRSTPINKPAQLYNRDVNLSRLYQKVRKYGGFNKVSANGKWKSVANKLGFSGISAGTEMKLLYRRYLVAFEEFYRKIGDTHMFEGSRSQRQASAGGRNVLPPRDRDLLHSSINETKVAPAKTKDTKESNKTYDSKSAAIASSEPEVKVKPEPTVLEDTPRRTPVRHASYRKDDRPRPSESPKHTESAGSRGRASTAKSNIKIEKAARLNLDKEDDKQSCHSRASMSPVPPPAASAPSTPSLPSPISKPKEEPSDCKTDNDSVMSDELEECVTVFMEVDYPPGTKVKVRYGRARNIKIYDAKVMEVRLNEEKQMLYSVHYNGWNVRYDEIITHDRIVGTTGRCEKRRMGIRKDGFGARKKIKGQNQVATSASSTGSRTPEPIPSGGRTSVASQKATVPTICSSNIKTTKIVSTAVVEPAPSQPNNRTTRSSITDTTPSRPTRSQSTDSALSAGLSGKKIRQKKSLLAQEEPKTESTHDAENEDSTEEESSAGDLDLDQDKSDKIVPMEVCTPIKTEQTELKESKEVQAEIETETETDRKVEESSAAPPEQSLATTTAATPTSDKTPRRTQRRASKHSFTSGFAAAVTAAAATAAVTTDTAAAAVTTSSPTHAAPLPIEEQLPADPGSAKKLTKKAEQSAIQAPCMTPMSSEVLTRMYKVIDRVADGEIAAETSQVSADMGDVDFDLCAPPAKRKKTDTGDFAAGGDDLFAKIESLKHKKPSAPSPSTVSNCEDTEVKDDDGDAETEAMLLPPLIGGSIKGNTTETESTQTSRASSGAGDSELSYHSSDNECKSPDPIPSPDVVVKCGAQAAIATDTAELDLYKMTESAISNLALLSEQASHMETTSSTRSRPRPAVTRRQQAKRSPRPKPSDADIAANYADTTPDQEVAHIISPSKILRPAPPRVPRQPRYNFKIQEELAVIEEQDGRISYLVGKLSEIRSLYSDVKSNLSSIERKRKRVRQRDREHVHNSY